MAEVRLSPRQAECLRLVYQRKTTKEIAAILNVAVGTANTYIAEGVAILGAQNRRDAAEILHAMEPPSEMRGESQGVPRDNGHLPGQPAPQRTVGWSDLLPLRPSGAAGNDLDLFRRLLGVVVLAALLAIAFGMLAVGLDVVSRFWTGR